MSCGGGSDGSLTLTVTNGTAPYQFAWSNGGTFNSISSLAAGAYTATITDNNGCTSLFNATINEPQAITVTAANAVDPNCANG
ncbi:SprB repeat-containing protein, partial [Vibrio parahaemolyticus]|nr:SprB repeat-containing protein [Vibrio parahaemolyticus]